MHGFSLLGDISYLRPPLPSPQLIRIRSLRLSWRFRDASTSIEGNTPHLLFLVTPWYSWSKKAKTNASSFPLYLPVFKIVGWFPSTSNGDHLFINIFLKIALWIKIQSHLIQFHFNISYIYTNLYYSTSPASSAQLSFPC